MKKSQNIRQDISQGKNRMVGKQSIEFGTPVAIRNSASVVGPKEGMFVITISERQLLLKPKNTTQKNRVIILI